MRKVLPIMLLAIFPATASIQGQPSAREVLQSDDTKPCVVIFGAVRAPSRIATRRRVRLHEVLAAAGGLTTHAGGTIQVIHTGSRCFQSSRAPAANSASASVESAVLKISDLRPGDEKADPYIVAGDVVIVSMQRPIYVAGNVFNPGEIYPKKPLTLTKALRLAGGVRFDAKTDKVVIYRHQKDDKAAVPVAIDLNEIKRHRAKDPVLEPYDIVYVGPGRPEPRFSNPMFDTRPLIPPGYRVIY